MNPPLIQSPLHIAAVGTLVRWWEYLRSHVLSITWCSFSSFRLDLVGAARRHRIILASCIVELLVLFWFFWYEETPRYLQSVTHQ